MTMTFPSTRPSRDEILIQSAHLWAKRSTCSRLQVGAVFARDGRILVTGYNGAPAGLPHCDHSCDCGQVEKSKIVGVGYCEATCRSQQPCTIAEHAERNAIAWAARHGVRLEGSSAYLTDSPCLPCAMSLINSGVERVVYDCEYRLTDGIELLRQAGIAVEQFELF